MSILLFANDMRSSGLICKSKREETPHVLVSQTKTLLERGTVEFLQLLKRTNKKVFFLWFRLVVTKLALLTTYGANVD